MCCFAARSISKGYLAGGGRRSDAAGPGAGRGRGGARACGARRAREERAADASDGAGGEVAAGLDVLRDALLDLLVAWHRGMPVGCEKERQARRSEVRDQGVVTVDHAEHADRVAEEDGFHTLFGTPRRVRSRAASALRHAVCRRRGWRVCAAPCHAVLRMLCYARSTFQKARMPSSR